MAIPIYKPEDQEKTKLDSKWVLANNNIKGLLKKIDQSKLFGFKKEGHLYFSKREILSAIEQHLTQK